MSQPDALLSARCAQAVFVYASAVDEHDADAMSALITDDVQLTRFDGTRQGREAFLAFYGDFWASSVHKSLHAVSNVRARPLEDGTILGPHKDAAGQARGHIEVPKMHAPTRGATCVASLASADRRRSWPQLAAPRMTATTCNDR